MIEVKGRFFIDHILEDLEDVHMYVVIDLATGLYVNEPDKSLDKNLNDLDDIRKKFKEYDYYEPYFIDDLEFFRTMDETDPELYKRWLDDCNKGSL